MEGNENTVRLRIWIPFLLVGFLSAANRAVANPIVVTYYWLRGASLFLPAALFVTVVEGLVLSRLLGLSRRSAFKFSFALNVFSAVACYPILTVAAEWYQNHLARNLYVEQLYYLPFRITEFTLLFMGSVVTEFLGGIAVGLFLRRLNFATKRFAAAIVLGNAFTYMVLSPIAYHLSAPPDRAIFSWTPDTSWALRPSVPVIYTTNDKTLAMINTDGSGAQTLLPFPMESYLISNNLNHLVYIQDDNTAPEESCCHYDRLTQTRTVLPPMFSRWGLITVDLSPSGTQIASLEIKQENDHSTEMLRVYDVKTGRVRESILFRDRIGRLGSDRRIAWSDREDVLYVYCYRGGLKPGETIGTHTRNVRLELSEGAVVSQRELESPGEISLCDNYGPFNYFVRKYWGTAKMKPNLISEVGDVKLYFGQGRLSAFVLHRYVGGFFEEGGPFDIFDYSKIILERPEGTITYDTRRAIREGILIHQGRECILGDGHCLYLANLENRRVGVLAVGATNPILLTPPE